MENFLRLFWSLARFSLRVSGEIDGTHTLNQLKIACLCFLGASYSILVREAIAADALHRKFVTAQPLSYQSPADASPLPAKPVEILACGRNGGETADRSVKSCSA